MKSLRMKRIYFCLQNVIGSLMNTGFFRIKMISGETILIFKFLGFTVYEPRKKIRMGKQNTNQKPSIYLKVNSQSVTSLQCIQNWLAVADLLNRKAIIVCDNKTLEYKIMKKCTFYNFDTKIMKSKRRKLNNMSKGLYEAYWRNATLAHLTPFYDTVKMDCNKHWNIDADDTIFLINPQKTAEVLKNVENYCVENDIDAMSLDMWFTRTSSKHWTLGVLYVNDSQKFVDAFNNTQNTEWAQKLNIHTTLNLDWFITYLKYNSNFKIKTFFVENLWFIHCGDLLLEPLSSGLYFWKNGNLELPILSRIYRDEKLGILKIPDDCVKFDIGIEENEGLNYLTNEFCITRKDDMATKLLMNSIHFSKDSQNFIPIK